MIFNFVIRTTLNITYYKVIVPPILDSMEDLNQ